MNLRNIKNNYSVDDYDANGFCLVEKVIDKKTINSIDKELKKILNKKHKIRKRDYNLINKKINSMHGLTRYSNFFDKLSKNKKILDVCRNLLNKIPKFRQSEYFAKPKKIGLESPYHQDNYYWNVKKGNALTVWIALSHADKRNGSLKYLVGSHKLGIIKHEKSFAPGSSQKINKDKIIKLKKKYKKVVVNLKPGDAIFHHCEIIHGSDKNKSNYDRRGLTMQFQARGSTIDKLAYKKYLIELNKQIELRKEKYAWV